MNVYNTFIQNSKTEKKKKNPGHKSFAFQWVDN